MRKYSKEVANISDEKFPLFASAITGRDYGILKKSIDIERSDAEKDHIGQGKSGFPTSTHNSYVERITRGFDWPVSQRSTANTSYFEDK